MARIWAAEAVKGTYDAVRPKPVQLFSTSTCACALRNGTLLAKLKLSDLRGLCALAPALQGECTCPASDALTTVCSAATNLGTVSQLQQQSQQRKCHDH